MAKIMKTSFKNDNYPFSVPIFTSVFLDFQPLCSLSANNYSNMSKPNMAFSFQFETQGNISSRVLCWFKFRAVISVLNSGSCCLVVLSPSFSLSRRLRLVVSQFGGV